MQYQGGKERIAKHLVEVMLSRRSGETSYLEPFMGGASVLCRMAPHFDEVVGADAMLDLVTMWESVTHRGWTPPETLTRDEYYTLRAASRADDPMTAFAAYGCSFGGKRWAGYAKDNPPKHPSAARAAHRSIVRKASTMSSVRFLAVPYDQHDPTEGTLVYADPPYAGTKAYPGAPKWDAGKFWAVMELWASRGATVFVSEYTAPKGWESIWSKEKHVSIGLSSARRWATEHLFVYAGAR